MMTLPTHPDAAPPPDMLDAMLIRRARTSVLQRRAKAVAERLVETPERIPAIAWRQCRMHWAGRFEAFCFWTLVLGAFEDAYYTKHPDSDLRFEPDYSRVTLCIERGSINPEQVMPYWMRTSPRQPFLLRLPKDNPYPVIMAKPRSELGALDLPLVFLAYAGNAFSRELPPVYSSVLTLWTAIKHYKQLMRVKDRAVARAFGMSEAGLHTVWTHWMRIEESMPADAKGRSEVVPLRIRTTLSERIARGEQLFFQLYKNHGTPEGVSGGFKNAVVFP